MKYIQLDTSNESQDPKSIDPVETLETTIDSLKRVESDIVKLKTFYQSKSKVDFSVKNKTNNRE